MTPLTVKAAAVVVVAVAAAGSAGAVPGAAAAALVVVVVAAGLEGAVLGAAAAALVAAASKLLGAHQSPPTHTHSIDCCPRPTPKAGAARTPSVCARLFGSNAGLAALCVHTT
jgi:hypothetical protein